MIGIVRRVRRRDPDAPLLVPLHDDGGDAGDMLAIGRRLWPGAPVASLHGRYGQGAGWRHLSEPARIVADLGVEAVAAERLARSVEAEARREGALVEAIAIGFGGGADAALVLLCRYPGLFAGAILCRLRRKWSRESLDEINQGNGVEVLVVAEPDRLNTMVLADLMLMMAGHHVQLRVASRLDELEICRAWLCRELGGECGDAG